MKVNWDGNFINSIDEAMMGVNEAFCHTWQLYIATFWLPCSWIKRKKFLDLKTDLCWCCVHAPSWMRLTCPLICSPKCSLGGTFEDLPQKLCLDLNYWRTLVNFFVNLEVSNFGILRSLHKIMSKFVSMTISINPLANDIFVEFLRKSQKFCISFIF